MESSLSYRYSTCLWAFIGTLGPFVHDFIVFLLNLLRSSLIGANVCADALRRDVSNGIPAAASRELASVAFEEAGSPGAIESFLWIKRAFFLCREKYPMLVATQESSQSSMLSIILRKP